MNSQGAAALVALMIASAGHVIADNRITHIDNPSVNDTSRVVDIDEVVIVSQPKESFRLRKQPVSSSMFSGGELQRMGLRDLRDLSLYVPSFSMPAYGSRYTSSIYIRGIGSRISSPAVGIYSDGLPLMSKSAYNHHNYELGRVDVLRGPQGTLYGINTEGGLIRTYSRDPLTCQGTHLRIGASNHFGRNVEVAHYARPNDKLAWSLAGFYNGQNGYLTNTTTGQRADQLNEAGGKLHLVGLPTATLKLDYILDYQYTRQNAFPYGVWNPQTDETALPSANRQGNYRRNMLHTGLILTQRWGGVTFSSTTSYQYLKDYMAMDNDYLPADFLQLEERQHQNTVTHEMVFKGAVPLGTGRDSRSWHWTAGSFTTYQWNKTEAPVTFYADMNTLVAGQIQTAMYQAMVQSMAARFVASGMSEAQAKARAEQLIASRGGVSMTAQLGTIPGQFHLPTFNQGIFHESAIDLTPRLTATLGLRYDYSWVKLGYDTQAQMTCDALVMGAAATAKLTSHLVHSCHNGYSQLLPKAGLSYRLGSHGSNVYAVLSKGYRAGGFNFQMFSDILQTELRNNSSQRGDYDIPHTADDYQRIAQTISYAPETTWNYEVGAHLNLLGNSLQMDIAGYLMQIHNQQLSVMAGNYGFGRMMVNAGRSRSLGVELSLRGSHLDNHLTWALNYGYTNSEFRDYTDAVTEDGATRTVSYRHRRVPYIPLHTLAANVDYRIALRAGSLQALVLGANLQAQGRTYWDETNVYGQKAYALLGAHADVCWPKVTVSLWSRNMTSAHYNSFAIESAASGQSLVFAQQGSPFQLGVDVRFDF